MSQFTLNGLRDSSLIHFIGIGGISMSGLAEIMKSRGYRVSGSDWHKSHITDRLETLGITVFESQSAGNVQNADVVVYTAAVKADNPELTAARENGAVTVSRAEFLGALMHEFSEAVGIAGTHGKTTTTSMLTHAMLKAGTDATVSIGGELDLIGGNVRTGHSKYFVTEACEYTNSFLSFYPKIAVITNIEEDHLDFFSGIDEIIDSFRRFAMLTKDSGYVVGCGDDENVVKALDNSGLKIVYYGMSDKYDYYPGNIKYAAGYPEFDVYKKGVSLAHLNMCVPGEHNIQNALASIAVCDLLCLDIDKCAEGICEFSGTKRRFEKKGELNGAVIFDDYAHHPTEIKATLNAASKLEHNKLWCVFQPHTYSRTRTLWQDFVSSFDLADEVIITHIYAAREVYDGVTNPDELAADIAKRGINVRYIEEFCDIEKILKNELQAGDIIFTMGAGNVVDIADDLCKRG